MSKVFAIASNAVSSLGMDVQAHWQAISVKRSGIKEYNDSAYSSRPFFASKLDPAQWQIIGAQTASRQQLSPFEQLALYSVKQALQSVEEEIDINSTAFVLSTTKGNIELLGQVPDERISLYHSARAIAQKIGLKTAPYVISQACISGVVALQYGLRLLQSGRYKNVIVTGCDRFTRFVLSGFESFHAIAHEPCRPFDADRKGITLGEAAGTVILSTLADNEPLGVLLSGATSNDANHISGPSRTGEELADAINRALAEAGINARNIDMLSAHGTATIYNDEMEAKAFDVAGLLNSPLHSFKGYIGHTLGASGVIESALILEALRYQCLVPSAGYENLGVPKPVKVTTQMEAASLNYVLKTASGFGGSNAAMVWQKA